MKTRIALAALFVAALAVCASLSVSALAPAMPAALAALASPGVVVVLLAALLLHLLGHLVRSEKHAVLYHFPHRGSHR